MATKPLPDQALLLKLLRYEPETGKLFWRERSPAMFTNTRKPDEVCQAFNTRYAGQEGFTAIDTHGYRHSRIFGVQHLAHRVIWKMITGLEPPEIDHENGERADNRWINLVEATHKTNHRNRKLDARNTSGQSGVLWRDGRWRVTIKVAGKTHSLGSFRDLDVAIRARKAAERRLGFHPNHGRKRKDTK